MWHERDPIFREEVLQALRHYRKADIAEQSAVTWQAVQTWIKFGANPARAVRDCIDVALERLSSGFAFESQLLTDRYVHGHSVIKVCRTHAVSERDCFRKCERGIDELTIIVEHLNAETRPFQALPQVTSPDFRERALTALMGRDISVTQHVLSRYPHPKAMNQLLGYLAESDVTATDRTHIIAHLHDVYHASSGDDLVCVAARQFSLHLLGSFASLESFFLLNHAWQQESHPWPRRAALLGSPTPAKYEEYLYWLDHNDQAREVARTFPRVYYGDQHPSVGLFQDDQRPYYAKTMQFYLSGYGRYIAEASLGLVLYVVRDLIVTKGSAQLQQNPPLLGMLRQALAIEPLHPLAQHEWMKLKLLARRLEDED